MSDRFYRQSVNQADTVVELQAILGGLKLVTNILHHVQRHVPSGAPTDSQQVKLFQEIVDLAANIQALAATT